jgi:hypothetical protein
MAKESEVNLDLVLDFRFTEIEAELSVILDHAVAVERQLPIIVKNERKRLEEELLEGLDRDEWYGTMQWIDEFAEDVLPRLFRSPILVELWAVFESAITEIAKYCQQQEKHSLSVNDLRGANDYERAQKYYEHVLRFSLIEDQGPKEDLDMLLLVRNAIAHCNARIEVIKPARLERMRRWEKEHGGIVVGMYYISFTADFVQRMTQAVRKVLTDLMEKVKAKY